MVLGAAWVGYINEDMLMEVEGRRLPLTTKEGVDAFYSNLEHYVRLIQSQRATVYLVLAVPQHPRFSPREMVTRSLSGFRIAPHVEKPIPTADLQAVYATVNGKLRAIGERTGATLLDPVPDICGSGEDCSPFFGAGEPKFSDDAHLRPVFVRQYLRFLDPLLK